MKKLKIDKMDRLELQELSRAIEARMKALDEERRRAALDEMSAVAKKHGLSLNDVVTNGAGRKRAEPLPKYRHPENAALTWSGRGRRPAWVHEMIERGHGLEELTI